MLLHVGAPEIPLEQVAAVFAAEQEGFSLPEVLAIEGIDESAWPDVRMSSLMSVATDPNEHHRYTAALHEAQDRLHCDVAPLYDDVGGSVAFIVATEQNS